MSRIAFNRKHDVTTLIYGLDSFLGLFSWSVLLKDCCCNERQLDESDLIGLLVRLGPICYRVDRFVEGIFRQKFI